MFHNTEHCSIIGPFTLLAYFGVLNTNITMKIGENDILKVKRTKNLNKPKESKNTQTNPNLEINPKLVTEWAPIATTGPQKPKQTQIHPNRTIKNQRIAI